MVVQMPGKEKLEAPYSPPGHVLGLLGRFRERGLPPVLAVEAVEDALGISKVYAYRALDSLQALGFLDDKNHPQPVFIRLRELSDEEYKAALAVQVKDSYPRLFEHLDLSKDTEQQIRDHFRRYDPPSQTQRQYRLFHALCVAAGLVEGKSQPKAPRTSPRPATPQGRHSGTVLTNNRGRTNDSTPPPTPKTDDDVRRLLAEALIEKIREVDASDWETMEKYLGKIEELSKPAEKPA